MKSMLLVGLLAVVGMTAGFFFFQNRKMHTPSQESVDAQQQVSDTGVVRPGVEDVIPDSTPRVTSDSLPESVGAQADRYVEYSEGALASSATSRRVLFFYASWCPTCKSADESFAQNRTQLPGDLTLIRVNYDDADTEQAEKELAREYGITYQHTFVQIDAQGNEVTKWNGGEFEELLEKIQ